MTTFYCVANWNQCKFNLFSLKWNNVYLLAHSFTLNYRNGNSDRLVVWRVYQRRLCISRDGYKLVCFKKVCYLIKSFEKQFSTKFHCFKYYKSTSKRSDFIADVLIITTELFSEIMWLKKYNMNWEMSFQINC